MMNKPFLTVLSPVSRSSAGYCRMGGSRARSPAPDQYSNFEKNLEDGTVFALQTAKSSRGSDEHVEKGDPVSIRTRKNSVLNYSPCC